MDINRLTQKSQEAIHDAQTKAMRFGHTEVDVEHLLLALLDQADGLIPRLLERAGVDVDAVRADVTKALESRPRVSGSGASGDVRVARGLALLLEDAEKEAARLKDEYVSVEHLVLAMLRSRAPAGKVLKDRGLSADRFLEVLTEVRGAQRVTSAMPEAAYEALEKYGRDLVAEARQRQAGPGHRARRRDPPRHPDPVAQDEEQPRARRRPRRRQDRDRRGARPADRAPGRPRGAEGQDDLRARHGLARRRREVPRRVRGAPEGGARRGQGGRGPDPAVHRRAAHRRRRRRGRGRDGRRQHAQADARPRRAALHRRDDAEPSTARSRRTPRWSAASSPSSSTSRRWRTRSRSCAGCASASRSTTG